MNKQQALEKMEQGQRVSHINFCSDEYLFMINDHMYAEDGCRFEEGFDMRSGSNWEDGWLIFNGGITPKEREMREKYK